MADHPVERLGGQTPLQYADTPYMDMLARKGRTGRLMTIPTGFAPGSEVANSAILGYDLNKVYEGRGPLEAASIGYEMQPGDMAMRCNIITLADGRIKNHHGGHLTTEQGDTLIKYLDSRLGNDRIKFITGTQYRHLLIIRGGNKHIECAPPHDHPDEQWRQLMVRPEKGYDTDGADAAAAADGQGNRRTDKQADIGIARTARKPSFQQGQGRQGQLDMAVEPRIQAFDETSLRNVSKHGQRLCHIGCRPDKGHRPLCRAAKHQR